ncbi:MAG: hypothetical protein J5912_02925 [Clostridia bacterium]|nr:hypothetical protein [Clostridia bacterium]
MKKIIPVLILLLAAGAVFAASGCVRGNVIPLFDDELPAIEADPDVHLKVTAAGEPEIIYTPPVGSGGYRYGPSIIYYADGSCDAWFSTNGSLGEWDWISVRHSDNGFDFGDERVVLVPNPNSMDKYSCCDPGVVYFGGYYYLGYTSTIEGLRGGVNNNVFVARSKNAFGPYEKWNGEGWGGDPAPIIYYDEHDLQYGAGEPSFVVVGDTLYMYYTWACPEGNYTRVSTSDTAEDWPARLQYRGVAVTKHDSQDSSDMVYSEDTGKFMAFMTQKRFSAESGIAVYESEDGISFYQTDFVRKDLYAYCHNMGIAKRPDGHIQFKDKLFVGYAFSDGASGNWGKWATAVQEIDIETYEGAPVFSPDSDRSVIKDDYFREIDTSKPIAISATTRIVERYLSTQYSDVSIIWFDSALGGHAIEDTKNIKFYGYDKTMLAFSKNEMQLLGKPGFTVVKVKYKGFESFFYVYVLDYQDEPMDDYNKTVVDFRPVKELYEVDLANNHKPQIRGLITFSDKTWGEIFNENELISVKKFPVTFESSDTKIAKVSDRGVVIPVAPGEVTVKVTVCGERSFEVKVVVKDSRE